MNQGKTSVLLVMILMLVAALQPSQTFSAMRGTVMTRNGMVSSAHPLASLVGVSILQRGGNAMDAAIAMAAVLSA